MPKTIQFKGSSVEITDAAAAQLNLLKLATQDERDISEIMVSDAGELTVSQARSISDYQQSIVDTVRRLVQDPDALQQIADLLTSLTQPVESSPPVKQDPATEAQVTP